MNNNKMRQIFAIEKANKERILLACPGCPDRSGIYFLLREEDGIRYAYIGQAKRLLSRLAGHLSGYQHIDLSLKAHGLWREDNPTGWKVHYLECEESALDEWERHYIRAYANKGYQLRNKTDGGQGEGKRGIAQNKPAKGYYDGLEQGKRKAYRTIRELFDKHLEYRPKSEPPTRYQVKAMEKMRVLLEEETQNVCETDET